MKNKKAPINSISKTQTTYILIAVLLLLIVAAFLLLSSSVSTVPNVPSAHTLSSILGSGSYGFCNAACLGSNNTRNTANFILSSMISFKIANQNQPVGFFEQIYTLNTSAAQTYAARVVGYNKTQIRLANSTYPPLLASGVSSNFTYTILTFNTPSGGTISSITGYKNNLLVSAVISEPAGGVDQAQQNALINTVAASLP